MHVIVLENEPSSQRGGQERSLLDVCQGLAQRGHRLSLLYVRSGDLLGQYQTFCTDWQVVSGYRFYPRHPLRSGLNLGRDIFKLPVTRDSVIYSNQYHDSLFGAAFARLRRVPFVCHLRVPPGLPLGLQWTWGMKGTDRLIAVSGQTQADWQAAGFGHKPIDVVYNAIDVDWFQPAVDWATCRDRLQLPAHGRVVTYMGRLDQVKGVETLLKAFAQLATDAPKVTDAPDKSQAPMHLLIAGKPLITQANYGQKLHQLARDLGIADQVHFLGHVSDPRRVYQASDLVVLPSEWSEPFGRVLIEAMACGVPAIGSDIGGIPEVLGEALPYPALFPAGDHLDLASRLKQLIDWRTHEPRLGAQCRQYVQTTFPLEKTIDGVEAALAQSLNRPIPAPHHHLASSQ